jgi:transcriptional regulator with XRE-family HTH domain
MDREQLAAFVRQRREALQPADVGLVTGSRRRTPGLRREEVAVLADISIDYYVRIEQVRGPVPSAQVLTTIARALRLDIGERDHLLRLAGHPVPPRSRRIDHVAPALLRVLDRLADTPAVVVSDLGDTLAQNPMAIALLGDQTAHAGLDRSAIHRWFTGHPSELALCPPGQEEPTSIRHAVHLRTSIANGGADDRTRAMVASLLERSAAFRDVWARHDIRPVGDEVKQMIHPELGHLELFCQRLGDTTTSQSLLVFTAAPGSESAEKLRLLEVIGSQSFTTP